MNPHYRNALYCWGYPLVLGVSTALLWWATNWDWLMPVGLLIFLMGMGCCCLGFAFLFEYWREETRRPNMPRRQILKAVFAGALLLLSNIPVAAGVLVGVATIATCFVVTVRNESRQTITDVKVFGGGCDVDFGDIGPGGAVKRRFWIQGDGNLVLFGIRNSAPFETIIEGYVTNNQGGSKRVMVQENDAIIRDG